MTASSFPLSGLFTLGSRRARFLVERNILVYRHGWIVILSGFFEPLFYLGSIGFGLGALIGTVNGPGGQFDPNKPFAEQDPAATLKSDEYKQFKSRFVKLAAYALQSITAPTAWVVCGRGSPSRSAGSPRGSGTWRRPRSGTTARTGS